MLEYLREQLQKLPDASFNRQQPTFYCTPAIYELHDFVQKARRQMPGVRYWYQRHKRTNNVQIFLFEKTGPFNIRIKQGDYTFRYMVYRGTTKLYDTDRLGDVKNLIYQQP